MQIKTILRLIGLLLVIFSGSMLTPLIINTVFHENFAPPFLIAFACTLGTGGFLWFFFRTHKQELKIRDGFLIVVLFWFVLCLFAALPFLLTIESKNGMTDALFESVSGFTTTGASVLAHLEQLPHALLFYRQQLQFLGGMGIVVLAVAILPMLGVGGMQLYRAETPGPMKDSKLTPRIAQTAKALWFIYFALTLLCMLSYWWAGMSWFDALGESFATISTGGFSMHDANFAYYKNTVIESLACFFMLLGGTNFALHFVAFKKRSLRHYWHDEEFRYYLGFLCSASLIVMITLFHYGYSEHVFIKSLFNVISMATTTGFIATPFHTWPTYVPVLIMLLSIIGGCAASTSGGIKVLRALLLFKQSKREMVRLLHPNAIMPIKFGKQVLPEPILQSMWGFLSAFIALFWIFVVLFMAQGNDFVTAFSSITAALTNSGSGLGGVSASFASLSQASKWLLMFAMLAGRLEIFSLLILFLPQYWRR